MEPAQRGKPLRVSLSEWLGLAVGVDVLKTNCQKSYY